jgi:hypothetical protein
MSSAVTAAQAAATRAAADLAPRVEAAGKAAQTAAMAYAAPRVVAARHAVTPVLETARDTVLSSVETVTTAADVRRRAAKKGTPAKGKKNTKATPESGRSPWPWFLVAAAGLAAAFLFLRRKKSDDLWPSPTGDGPVPSYREDPVPSSPSDSGKTVSSAQTAPGDATPPDSDLGMQAQQMSNPAVTEGDVPEPTTSTGGSDAVSTSTNDPGVSEGPGVVDPTTDATNSTDTPRGPAGTPVANRGVEPEGGPNPA